MQTIQANNLWLPFLNPKWMAKIGEWIRRYLVADLAATVTGILGVYWATNAGADLITVAYVGSIAEAIGYYVPLFWRDYRTQRSFDKTGAVRRTIRNLLVEFGVAEIIDSAFLRPFFMAIFIKLIPNLAIATYVGMTVADVTFYSQAIVGYELRKRFLPDPNTAEESLATATKTVSRRRNSDTVMASYIDRTTRPAAVPFVNDVDYEAVDYEAVDDEAITVVSLDDQVTHYAADPEQEIPRRLLGKLVRITKDKSLPQELPIYQLTTEDNRPRQIYIGRHSKNNTLVIPSKHISREHAVLVQKADRLYLRDSASTLGTFLNWRKLQFGEELLIRNNDQVNFGDISYVYRAVVEE